jgi:glycosyltransferase involved in cell wall biosynthesis
MNILFYTISNKRSRDIESQAMAFAQEGHRIFLLTQSDRSQLHDFFESKKFSAQYSKPLRTIFPLYVVVEVIKLVWFCYRHRITVVHAHLDPCCLIAVQAQFLLHAKVIVTRHHADALRYETTEKNQRISRNIYAKAKTVVAVSQNVKQFMVEEERIEESKITVIPLSYNFDLYEKPSVQAVEAIRLQYATSLLFCTVGRVTGLKRMNLIIEFIDRLIKAGLDCKLMIVGKGPEEAALKQQVEILSLQNQIFFVGFSNNVLPYIAAADYYLHFSITEATCTTVKEAALVGTPVIVCQGVGDFDQYIKHKENSYLVSKADPVTDAVALLHEIYPNEPMRKQVGEQLRKTIVSFFAIERAMPVYKAMHEKILNV